MVMNVKIASYLFLFAAFSSCSALKTLSSSHDNSSTASSSSSNSSAPSFIDNISVTPGASGEKPSVVKSRNGNGTTATEAPKRIKAVNLNPGETNPAVLQMKYATILNVSADKLTNIPLLQDIDHWWGTQYCLGGNTEDCIDCSGFTQTIMRDVYALNIPRVASDQYDSTLRIDDNQLSEGDLVFFHTTGRGHSITHVGVYITNNHFAHASTSGGVTISTLDDPYWKPKYVAAGRVKRA
jgi:cell wall-associated NlpC family hydrolase